MFVTNLTAGRLGINGVINLAPGEVNRYIPDTADLLDRVAKLEAGKHVSVIYTEGKTKTGITGKIVKTVGIDTAALSTGPRTAKAEEVKPEKAETVVAEKVVEKEPAKAAAKTSKRNTEAKAEAKTASKE